MGVVSLASMESAYRGFEYYQQHRATLLEQKGDDFLIGKVQGSDDNCYDVAVNIGHPRQSNCTCPHAAGRRVVCKHMVALYFTAYPKEAEQYILDLENSCAEAEEYQRELEHQVVTYVTKMKKAEMQQALLQLLFDGPEWQYRRFIEEHLEADEEDEENAYDAYDDWNDEEWDDDDP